MNTSRTQVRKIEQFGSVADYYGYYLVEYLDYDPSLDWSLAWTTHNLDPIRSSIINEYFYLVGREVLNRYFHDFSYEEMCSEVAPSLGRIIKSRMAQRISKGEVLLVLDWMLDTKNKADTDPLAQIHLENPGNLTEVLDVVVGLICYAAENEMLYSETTQIGYESTPIIDSNWSIMIEALEISMLMAKAFKIAEILETQDIEEIIEYMTPVNPYRSLSSRPPLMAV